MYIVQYIVLKKYFVGKPLSHSTPGWFDVVENNFWPPTNHMLEMLGIHIWKYSSITRVGISDDGLLL